MLRTTAVRRVQVKNNQRLNNGSNMTMSSVGLVGPKSHRIKMPWAAAKEPLAFMHFHTRDKKLLDGHNISYGMERTAQLDPIEVLKGAVSQRKYLTSTGYTVAQLAAHLPYNGRGQVFYRKEWREGTYEKSFTLANIEMERDTPNAKVFGYLTFHGETTLEPVDIDYVNTPGWYVEFDETSAVPFGKVVKAPPSEGTEVPVDPKKYKLKAYPYYDAPNPTDFVHQLLKDRGLLPDTPEDGATGAPGDESDDGTVDVPSSA